MENYTFNLQQQKAFEFLNYTKKNIFLTGKAGTGKTTFLHTLKKVLPKRMIVVAPTGVAAINAGGVTIHSFFQMPFGPQIPDQNATDVHLHKSVLPSFLKISHEKINIIRSLDIIIIDEISMVRADLLDGIDQVVRRFRRNDLPFGGIQLLMIGDLLQLSPVAKDDEWEILSQYYETPYFFSSRALKNAGYISIELRDIYRQSDQEFIGILNKIRENQIDQAALTALNKRYIPESVRSNNKEYITLTTHNIQAKKINDQRLQALNCKEFKFTAEITDEFPEYMYPADYELVLKVGAQVMFVKNDITPEKRFFNGKIGNITHIGIDSITIKCKDDISSISVERMEWQNMKYTLNPETKMIDETIIGVFKQFPLKLAWAVTIHKSQGLTFDNVIIDCNAAFAHGQVYVALSRCRTLEGIVLQEPVITRSIKTDNKVITFTKSIQSNPPDNQQLETAKRDYEKSCILDLFDFDFMHKNMNILVKSMNENSQSVTIQDIQTIEEIRAQFRSEIIDVAEKFSFKIDQLISTEYTIENNVQLQDYIRRACPYFVNKLKNEINSRTEKICIDSDNKKVNKELEKHLKNVVSSINQKVFCLEKCSGLFTVPLFLDARAKMVLIESDDKKKSIKEFDETGKQSINPELVTILRAWRKQKADESSLPVYAILPQKTLILLADTLPGNENQIKEIHGIGKKKFQQYKDELLDIIATYCSKTGLQPTQTDSEPDKTSKVHKKIEKNTDTKRITYEMYKEGKSIETIASERNLALTTIEGHIAYHVGIGEIDIHSLLSDSVIEMIEECFSRLGSERLTPVKVELGESVSYGQLRLVQSYIEFKNKQQHD